MMVLLSMFGRVESARSNRCMVAGIIAVVQHGRPNVWQEVLLHGQIIERAQEGQCLVLRHPCHQFRQGLRGDAKGFHFVSGRHEPGFRLLETARASSICFR